MSCSISISLSLISDTEGGIVSAGAVALGAALSLSVGVDKCGYGQAVGY